MVSSQSMAVDAFDAVAERFDGRFGHLLSVAAQRRAVRRELLRCFPAGSRLLELGGGTGDDAVFLAQRGRRVVMTDGSERMVRVATDRVRASGCEQMVESFPVLIEEIGRLVDLKPSDIPFDGVFSNFAALNCVEHLAPVGRALAGLVRPGGLALLVVFGPFPIGEVMVQLGRGRVSRAFRRFRGRGSADAQLNGRHFRVWYPGPREVARAFEPFFRLRGKRGIGVLVPPSDAEPDISAFPRVVRFMEATDRVIGRPMAILGDHVLLTFERTQVPIAAVT